MKLISWNVNGFRAILEKGFGDFFASANADILCLKELKASASSGGDIRYTGNCIVSSKRSSGGTIKSR